MKKILIATILIISLSALSINVVGAPIVEKVTLDPEKPSPKSTITFSAVITGEESIDGIWIIVEECKKIGADELCFINPENKSMDLTDVDDTYKTQITLNHGDATYIKYHFEIKSKGKWIIYERIKVDLSIDTDNDSSNDGDVSNGSPGFEVILFLIATSLVVILLKRKRY